MSSTAASRVCGYCSLPIEEGGGQRLGVSWVHRELVHCDQLIEVSDVAMFLEHVVEQHDARDVSVAYTRRSTEGGVDRFWKIDVITRTGSHRVFEQGMGESLPDFLLRVTGGLVELS